MTQVIFYDIDIFDRVLTLPKITEKRTFRRDKLIANEYDIIVENIDNFFTTTNTNSLVYGTTWLYKEITVIDDGGETIWDGIVIKITRDHERGTATITSKNKLYSFKDQPIEYESSTWETAGDVFKNISANIGFTNYDNNTLDKTILDLQNANCYIKANFNSSAYTTFGQVIEKLATYSNSDAYSHTNNVFFVHWTPNQQLGSISITEKDMKKLPSSVKEDDSQIINEFSIGYFGDQGVPATDAANNNIGSFSRTKYQEHALPDMRSGDGVDAQIIFKELASALYIGEGYIKKTHKDYTSNLVRPLTSFRFNLFKEKKEFITLQSLLNIVFVDGGWDEVPFEIFEFTISEEEDDIRILVMEAA